MLTQYSVVNQIKSKNLFPTPLTFEKTVTAHLEKPTYQPPTERGIICIDAKVRLVHLQMGNFHLFLRKQTDN